MPVCSSCYNMVIHTSTFCTNSLKKTNTNLIVEFHYIINCGFCFEVFPSMLRPPHHLIQHLVFLVDYGENDSDNIYLKNTMFNWYFLNICILHNNIIPGMVLNASISWNGGVEIFFTFSIYLAFASIRECYIYMISTEK